MHYRPRWVPRTGHVASADRMSREFMRAEGVLTNLDQNNMKDAGFATADLTEPMIPSAKSTTLVRNSAGILLTNPNAGGGEALTRTTAPGTPEVDRGEWVPVFDGAGTGTTAELSFDAHTTMPIFVIGQIQGQAILGASAPYMSLGLRLVLNGTPGDVVCRAPLVQDAVVTVVQSVYVEEVFIVPPGRHTLSMQATDYRDGDTNIVSVTNRTTIAYGFAR